MHSTNSIIFTTPVLGYPAAGGPELRIQNTIKALAQQCDVHLLSRVKLEKMGGKAAMDFYSNICKSVEFVPQRRTYERPKRFLNRITNRLTGRKLFRLPTFEESLDYDYIIKMAQKVGARIIWLGYGNISYPLLKYLKENSDLKVVCDTDSVWSRFVLRELEHTTDPIRREQIAKSGRIKEEEERWGTALADVTAAVSEVDQEYYQALTRDTGKVKIVSNVIDLDHYNYRKPDFVITRPALLLAGSFWKNSPMEHAALWTLNEVMPIVWRIFPVVQFYILGKGSKESLAQVVNPHVSILGRVESVLPYLCNVDVALVPLKFESGTRFKILEAGACGIPIVSTTLGAEGIPVVPGRDILIGDTPDEFANGIITLLTDKAKATMIAGGCRRLVAEYYGLPRAIRETGEVLAYLDSTR